MPGSDFSFLKKTEGRGYKINESTKNDTVLVLHKKMSSTSASDKRSKPESESRNKSRDTKNNSQLSSSSLSNNKNKNKNKSRDSHKSSTSTNSEKTDNMKSNQPPVNSSSSSSEQGPATAIASTTTTAPKMDTHPYQRGSVIEVLYIEKSLRKSKKNKTDSEENYSFSKINLYSNIDNNKHNIAYYSDQESFGSDSSDEENGDLNQMEIGDDEASQNSDTTMDIDNTLKRGTKKKEKPSSRNVAINNNNTKKGEPRLCDVIDRVQIKEGGENTGIWRYYVHYREFNRRMDEWIDADRILNPPSIGAQKLKQKNALKKKQQMEKDKKKYEKEKSLSSERNKKMKRGESMQRRLLAELGDHNPNGTSMMMNDPSTVLYQRQDSGEGLLLDETNQKSSRLTRRQKRKASVSLDPKDLDVPSSQSTNTTHHANTRNASQNLNNSSSSANNSSNIPGVTRMVPLPNTATLQQIGENLVATVEAQELDEHEGLDEASLREHEEVTKVKNVVKMELGKHGMETWYFSPIPKELLKDGIVEVLYVCEFTLNFFTRKKELLHYQSKHKRRHPPGNEIYRNGNLSMFEVDGYSERIYCQNLCYIAKLFLDHKTLYFDVDPFLFYILCEVDERGFHPVGYFSKEKYSDVGYNLACILTFPCHQRKGYGRFLISFSYELSKKEEKVGSPEKPMSDLGQKAYIPYWISTIIDLLYVQCPDKGHMSIMDIAKITSIMAEDIVFTLNQLGILKYINGEWNLP